MDDLIVSALYDVEKVAVLLDRFGQRSVWQLFEELYGLSGVQHVDDGAKTVNWDVGLWWQTVTASEEKTFSEPSMFVAFTAR